MREWESTRPVVYSMFLRIVFTVGWIGWYIIKVHSKGGRCHQFIQLVVEGDELYSKDHDNKVPTESLDGLLSLWSELLASFGNYNVARV